VPEVVLAVGGVFHRGPGEVYAAAGAGFVEGLDEIHGCGGARLSVVCWLWLLQRGEVCRKGRWVDNLMEMVDVSGVGCELKWGGKFVDELHEFSTTWHRAHSEPLKRYCALQHTHNDGVEALGP